MQGCHRGPAIQHWKDNKSFVPRLEEVLLNMDIVHPLSHSSTIRSSSELQ